MSNDTPVPDNVRDAQAEVDRIRADLAATVDALIAKADVASRTKDRIEAAGEQVHDTYEAAREKLRSGDVRDRLTPRTIAIGAGSAVLVVAAVLLGRRR